jgi:hypothetical protein
VYKLTDVSEVLSAFIALIMEAISTSAVTINFYQISRGNIPQDSHLHTSP